MAGRRGGVDYSCAMCARSFRWSDRARRHDVTNHSAVPIDASLDDLFHENRGDLPEP